MQRKFRRSCTRNLLQNFSASATIHLGHKVKQLDMIKQDLRSKVKYTLGKKYRCFTGSHENINFTIMWRLE
jgi:hypothetical protein